MFYLIKKYFVILLSYLKHGKLSKFDIDHTLVIRYVWCLGTRLKPLTTSSGICKELMQRLYIEQCVFLSDPCFEQGSTLIVAILYSQKSVPFSHVLRFYFEWFH